MFLMVHLFSCSNNESASVAPGYSDESSSPDLAGSLPAQDTGTPEFPEYTGFINDYTGTLSSGWLSKTRQLAKSLEEETTCEVGVAVIDSLGGIPIEEYAAELFEKWGIGKKDKDNGVLLIVAVSDRQLRIEVGYGLEPFITDLEAKAIIDEAIIPSFKQDEYGPGIYNGVASISNIIYKEWDTGPGSSPAEIALIPPRKPFVETWGFPFLIVFLSASPWIIIGLVALFLFLRHYIREHFCPGCKKLGIRKYIKVLTAPTYEYSGRQEVERICRYCGFHEIKTVTIPQKTKATYSSGSHGDFSSHSSGSFSSGSSSSGHSFGGGSSGGGGASGRW
ncbi:MAG: TPM domain-containing protein [Actinobacteria bacterium]|nr:TPM domain-containing protein [Actinomycetota bacterium]